MSDSARKLNRYQTPMGVEGEYQPGSRKRVLCNLKGITHKSIMDAEEFDSLVRVQSAYLEFFADAVERGRLMEECRT
jgi:hypothetical protein